MKTASVVFASGTLPSRSPSDWLSPTDACLSAYSGGFRLGLSPNSLVHPRAQTHTAGPQSYFMNISKRSRRCAAGRFPCLRRFYCAQSARPVKPPVIYDLFMLLRTNRIPDVIRMICTQTSLCSGNSFPERAPHPAERCIYISIFCETVY